MSYVIIQPKTSFLLNEVKARGNYLEKNKLWKINNGDQLLYFAEGETGFLREIGLDTIAERVTYASFIRDEFKAIVRYFFQKGELFCLDYHDLDNDCEDDLKFLLKQLQTRSKKDEVAVASFMEEYTYFVDEVVGDPWYITIFRDKQQVKIYPSGVIYSSFLKGEESEGLILGVYEEIFDLLQKPFSLSPVLITEKEKTVHPLTNAHNYLSELFQLAGESAGKNINLPTEEAEKIKSMLLDYTKEFENKLVYKK